MKKSESKRRVKIDPDEVMDDFITSVGGMRKVKFCKRRWRFAFAIPGLKIGVEIDHGFIGRIKFDKFNAATLMGWSFFRFTEHEVRSGEAVEMLESYIVGRAAKGQGGF
ncbi:MAG: hypothetical protein WC373_15840 [Smithella sp.]